jgi:RHS repeat-associated protein
MLASKQIPVSNPEKKVFYHNDYLGGVNVITDESGARVQLTEYDPWGKVSRSEGNVDPENRFTGQKLDPESGLYYYGARYYDPDLGRFISPDSIVPAVGDPQSHNRYSYARNNPVKYTDPTGHSFLSAFFGGIFKAFSIIMKYAMPAFRIAAGVLELMGGGGGILSGLQSIASGMSGFIKNSQFQFASQVFGFFGGGSSGGIAAGDGVAEGDGGGIGPVPGYSENGANSWRAANDETFIDAAYDYNTKYGLQIGDPGYRSPQFIIGDVVD